MRVLVCGGRGYADRGRVWHELTVLGGPDADLVVIEGGCRSGPNEEQRGADYFAWAWAVWKARPCITMTAPFRTLGKRAGPIRNGWMLEHAKPDLVLAFPGGRGTANMIEQAEKAGVEVRRIEP